jgi:hypothetical protein
MKIKLIPPILFMFLTSLCNAGESESYLSSDIQFIKIKDVNRQSEAWGVCSAFFKITASFLSEESAQAKQLRDFSRGAGLAVIMTNFTEGLTDDISTERFSALWTFSKHLGNSIPEAQLTGILAD